MVRIHLKKSGTKIPRVELEEVGPSINLVMRRNKIATESLFKEARKIPKAAKVRARPTSALHLIFRNLQTSTPDVALEIGLIG